MSKRTYNPCDNCEYSFSSNNEETGMCEKCEFEEMVKKELELSRYKDKIRRLEKHKSEEPNNGYHDWDKEIEQQERNIIGCVLDEE